MQKNEINATLPLEKKDVFSEKKTSVCFVCTGNTCRSPMAEAVLKHLSNGAYTVLSAGLAANEGEPISENAVKALKKAGIECTPENDYEHHRASNLTEETVRQCDKIVAISGRHLMALIYAFPQYAEKMTVMPTDIPDPFMQGENVYEACLESITDCIRRTFAI